MGLSYLRQWQVLVAKDESTSSLFQTLPWGCPRHPGGLDLKLPKVLCLYMLKTQLRYCLSQEAFLKDSELGSTSFLLSSHIAYPSLLPALGVLLFHPEPHCIMHMHSLVSQPGSSSLRVELGPDSSLCPSRAQGSLMLAADE